MAIRNIVKVGDDILRKKSRPVDKIDGRILGLLDDMVETLRHANGAGLAAVQVGVLRRVVVIEVDGQLIELINPEIIEMDGEQTEFEGCLSMPGKYGEVKRPARVKVRARNRKGKICTYEGEGLLARAFCHEIDHLNGQMFSEKVIRWMPEGGR